MAKMIDSCGNVEFCINLLKFDINDEESEDYKYILFDVYISFGEDIISMNNKNHISIKLLKLCYLKLRDINEGIKYKRL